MSSRTYRNHRRQMVIVNVPVAATVILAIMLVYIAAQLLLSPEGLGGSVTRYAVQLIVPLVMWRLANGEQAQTVLLICDFVFTLALSSHLLLPSAQVGATALSLSLKMLATPLLIGWDPRAQILSSITTMIVYSLMLAFAPHELSVTNTFHWVIAPAIAASLSIVGAMRGERAQSEAFRRSRELSDSEASLRALIETGPDGILVIDGSRISFASPPLLRLLGCPSAAEIEGRELLDLVPPERRAAFANYLGAARDGEIAVTSLETQIIATDGRPIDVAIRAALLEADGRPRLQLVARDITERTRVESEKASLLQITSALARVGPEIISAVDTADVLERLCRLSAEVLNSEVSHTFLHQPDDDAWVAAAGHGDSAEQWTVLQQLRVPQAVIEPLLTLLRKDGLVQVGPSNNAALGIARLQALANISLGMFVALRRGDEIVGIQSVGFRRRTAPYSRSEEQIARGIGQLGSLALENARLVDELEQANRVKSDFVATMSHELRTPLNVIIGYNDLLVEGTWGSLNQDQTDSLQRMGRSARELLELITATLDLSRLERGRVTAETYPIDLTDLMAEIDADTRAAGLAQGVRLLWRLPPELPPLRTDPTKLKVILKNLVNNAVKFTPKGSIAVTLRLIDDGVEFQVTDSGIGIADHAIERIFEPFTQADSSVGSRFGGAGLGLHIVRRLLDILGGTIRVESILGQGTTFRVWLPAEPIESRSQRSA